MSKTRTEVIKESKRKGLLAGASVVGTVVIATASFPVAIVAAVPTAVLGYRWWKHRAENGIRF